MTTDEIIVAVCVVDDDPDTLFLIEKDLREAGIFNYQLYDTARKFLEEFNERMNVVVLDHHLGGQETGFNILRRIAENNAARKGRAKTKVIIMSGTTNISIPAHYINTQQARFYIDKNNEHFHKDLIAFTRIAIAEAKEEIMTDIEKESYMRYLKEKAKNVDARMEALDNLLKAQEEPVQTR